MEISNIVFLNKMEKLLGCDFQKFLESYNSPPFKAIRVNTLKCDIERFQKCPPYPIQQIPFCKEGFYVEQAGLGHHPYHHAGVYYVQEPSAMSAVAVLDPQPGEKILDLCAAPGGKSTQIAARLGGQGLVVCNEYVASRSKTLLSNIERMGVTNALVTNMHPDQLCAKFIGWFDRVLVDAPCSGEGMFRKDPNAVTEWSDEHSKSCAQRQLSILESAKTTVKEGGILVYSTCTFSLDENEQVICAFLDNNPDFVLEDIDQLIGERSRPEWMDNDYDLTKMHRVFPFNGGEGHFVAKLKRISGGQSIVPEYNRFTEHTLFIEFWEQTFDCPVPKRVSLVQDNFYIIPNLLPNLNGIKTVRAGILAGKLLKNRFVPEHQLFKCGYPVKQNKRLNLALDDPRVNAYLKGMELPCDDQTGYCVVELDGFALGFGKASSHRMKNHYPKGLRELR